MVDTYGDVPCDDTLARLDYFANALNEEPSARGYVIVYGGKDNAFGRVLHRLKHAKLYLENTRRIDAGRVVTIDGGRREELTVEAWIVPAGAAPPAPTASSQVKASRIEPRKFDYGYVEFHKEGGKYVLSCCDICPLEVPDLREYATAIKQEPESRAYIFIYFGFGDFNSYSGIDRKPGGFRRMAGLLKGVLVRDYGMDASRIQIAYGGGRETLDMELWVVPRGASNPKPTPTHFRRRRR